VAGTVADVMQVSARFMRSVNLERDFSDSSVLRSYVVTPQAKAHMARLAEGLASTSTQRAWRITGDYGTGKSSFALALAHALSGRTSSRRDVDALVDFKRIGLRGAPKLLPVLVTGAREPMSIALLRALRVALEGARGGSSSVLKRIVALAGGDEEPADEEVLRALDDASKYVRFAEKGTGLLIIVDELGKFLEYAAMNPGKQDIYFLQRLAEVATRSGDAQLFVVGILHQGFNAYAEHLSPAAQREWEKVAGRFEELLFNQPVEQTATLVAEALGVREADLPRAVTSAASQAMDRAIALGWYGAGVSRTALRALAPRMYPLHPTVLPVLVRLFSRFGQNERSLFSFLFSTEPFGLLSHADRQVAPDSWYELHHLYDYARAAFGHRLSVQSYRSHWNQLESLVSSFATEDGAELRVLKTVAMLNLLDSDGLLATDEAISLANGSDLRGARSTPSVVSSLRERRILYNRGAAGGYCLWPHTSVNLERAYEAASAAVATPVSVAAVLADQLDTRPIVARRHYIKTGNLRYFEVEYRAVGNAAEPKFTKDGPDGRIIIFLCETDAERVKALSDACGTTFRQPDTLVAIPNPLQGLAGLVQEVHRWKWIAHNTPELNYDSYAMAEVSRQIQGAERVLDVRLQESLGLRHAGGGTELRWYRQAKPLQIRGARELLSKLSDVCDEVYREAPVIKNELVNRRQLSSAAAAARMRLIERSFSSAGEACLGMDSVKAPPEMSMYLSVLEAGRLHRKFGTGYRFANPPSEDPCKLLPSLNRLMDVLTAQPDARVSVARLLEALYVPPYGVREGVAYLLFAAFARIHENELAFYENDVFVRQLGAAEMQRLVKSPASFSTQYCRVAGVRSALFEHLIQILMPDRVMERELDVLDIVRPLCVFAAQLPPYSQKTLRVDATAQAVRAALISAKEPAPLLFNDLPRACGFEPFSTRGGSAERSRAAKFAGALKSAIDELKFAYPSLLDLMRSSLGSAFERPTDTRVALRTVAEPLLFAVRDASLRALCLRFTDVRLGENEWLESIGSLVCEKPPSKWIDADLDRFRENLERFAARFARIESLQFPTGTTDSSSAMRVAITRPDGTEVDKVLQIGPDEEDAAHDLEAALLPLLRQHEGHVALVAAMRAVWKELARYEGEAN